MGFFSWKCSKSGKSIPAYPYAKRPIEDSDVVLVLPDNSTVKGIYDGYGNITTADGSELDIYDLMAKFYTGKPEATRDDIFTNTKYMTSPEGTKYTIEQFNWEEPIKLLGGKTLNQLKGEGWEIESDYDRSDGMVKLVRADCYLPKEDTYENLKSSEDCPDQGFFYGDDDED
jgi:hypothetical protein